MIDEMPNYLIIRQLAKNVHEKKKEDYYEDDIIYFYIDTKIDRVKGEREG